MKKVIIFIPLFIFAFTFPGINELKSSLNTEGEILKEQALQNIYLQKEINLIPVVSFYMNQIYFYTKKNNNLIFLTEKQKNVLINESILLNKILYFKENK